MSETLGVDDVRPAKRNRIYSRKFDWNKARDMREAGHTWKSISQTLGVSQTAVQRVCSEDVYRRMKDYTRQDQRSGKCVDCGSQCAVNRTDIREGRRHQRCKTCATRHQATTVRPHELQCRVCKQWLPDEKFYTSERNLSRRGKKHDCKECDNRARVERFLRRRGSSRMSRPLPRYTNTTDRDQAQVDKAVGNTNPTTWHITHQPTPQDLRGIPIQAKGVGGTSPHTNPLTETIRRNP